MCLSAEMDSTKGTITTDNDEVESSADEPYLVLHQHSPPVIVPRVALTEKYATSLIDDKIAVAVCADHQKIAWSLLRQRNSNYKFWNERFLEMLCKPRELRPGWIDFLEITMADYAEYEISTCLENYLVKDSFEFLRQSSLAKAAHTALIQHAVHHWSDWYQTTGHHIENNPNWRDPFDRAIDEGMSVIRIFLYQFTQHLQS